MSAHSDMSTSIKIHQDLQVSKGLAASRWAPVAIDDQMMEDQQMAGINILTGEASKPTTNSLTNSRWAPGSLYYQDQQMTDVKLPTDKVSKAKTNSLANSRWATDAAEPLLTGKNKTTKVQQKKHPNSMLNQPPSRASRGRQATPTTTPTTTTRRIIGPLSEEEKTVKMENPFFNPEKHKGLSSSRWAD